MYSRTSSSYGRTSSVVVPAPCLARIARRCGVLMTGGRRSVAAAILIFGLPSLASADCATCLPTLSLSAKSKTVLIGSTATLTWKSTYATSCAATGGWSGDRAINGTETLAPPAGSTVFTLTCTGEGGTIKRSVTISSVAMLPPSVTLKAAPTSVISGAQAVLSWTSTAATGCTASGGWSGPRATSGSESTGAISADSRFTLSCSNEGGATSRSVTVKVTSPPAISLVASPMSILAGQSTELSWSVTNASSCTALDGWSGTKSLSGTEGIAVLEGTTSFTLECTGAGGTNQKSVVVAVLPVGSVSRPDAFRFLGQASFGPTESSVAELIAMGDAETAYNRWLDGQMTAPASLQLPATEAAFAAMPYTPPSVFNARRSKWFNDAINGPDQLRQRVAFALSQILVVSEYGPLRRSPLSVASFNDTLVSGAFGNFRDLLEEVTLHPAMGVYLSMLGNKKPDAANNIRADENYARELMQLFSIGLVQLNLDGTRQLDADGQPIPTYDQAVVEHLARVLTGWNYAGASSFATAVRTNASQVVPMQAYPEQHDTESKTLLSYPGATKVVLPAGQTPQEDLRDALDNIFNHPNVGPYIAKQLILRLVTSNPSPAYVARVATVFNDDGKGVRGNLQAVVRAILLDSEARAAPMSDTAGKLKEPLLRMVQFLRAYEAKAASGEYRFDKVDAITGQGHLMSPSVFNFFSPAYAPAGEIAARALVAPELEIVTEYHAITFANYLFDQVTLRSVNNPNLSTGGVAIDITDEILLAGDPPALVSHAADKLLGGQMSSALRSELVAAANRVPSTKPDDRVEEVLFLLVTSPEFAALR